MDERFTGPGLASVSVSIGLDPEPEPVVMLPCELLGIEPGRRQLGARGPCTVLPAGARVLARLTPDASGSLVALEAGAVQLDILCAADVGLSQQPSEEHDP